MIKIPEISTGEFSSSTLRIIAVDFIRSISAIIFVITFPGAEDATTIAAPVFRGFTEEKMLKLLKKV